MPNAPHPTVAPNLAVFDRNLRVLTRTVEGVGDAAAATPLFEGGSHLHWLLGHLVVSRDGLLRHLGAEPVWGEDAAASFGRGSTPDARPTATIAEQIGRLGQQQAQLEATLATVDDATLARPAGRMTVAAWIEFLAWHETYHVGQATLYRRAAGLASAIG